LCDAQIVETDGRYSLSTDLDHVTLEFWSCNSYCYLPYSSGCWNAGDPLDFYVRRLEFNLWNPGGVNELEPFITDILNLNWAGAFNICRWIQAGADFVNQCCGDPGVVLVRWGYNCSQPRSYYRADTVKILSSAAGDHSNRDEWDKSVILHEYGHHFTNRFAEFPDSADGTHYWDHLLPAAPYVYEHLAWDEAIASWFAGVVLGEGRYVNLGTNNDTLSVYLFERPEPDVPYYVLSLSNIHQYWSSSLTPLYPGSKVEGAIGEALWDIYDAPDDTNFWGYNGNIWGHNNDQNQYDSWAGTAAILDVYMNYDPFPSDPHHNHPWDITEFANGWGVRGYPVTGHFQDILLAHAIDVCTCGNANSDGSIDISDVVFLIAYIFSGGAAPGFCNYAKGMGDANGDLSADISDCVFLIAYVFSGGAAPHCH